MLVALRWWTNLKALEAAGRSESEAAAKAAAAAAEAAANSELTDEQMTQEVELLSLAREPCIL